MSNLDIRFTDAELNRDIDRIVHDNTVARISLHSLDRLIDGVRPGRVVVLSAEPGAGKTSLLNQLADDFAAQGHIVLFFTFEIATTQLIAKSIARLSEGQIAVNDIAGCDTDPRRFSILHEAVKRYAPIASRISYIEKPCSALDVGVLVARCEREYEQKPIVMVDYVQLVPSSADKPPVDERLQIKEAISGLRRIANGYDIPVFAISSIGREHYEKSTTSLKCLGGSSSVEYSADSVLFLSVEGKGEERTSNLSRPVRPVVVTALKNRYCATGSAYLNFIPDFATFMERQ